MNWLVLISGVVALFATVGHLTMGTKTFLAPMLTAQFDEVPKRVMYSVFHYISWFQISSAAALLLVGFGFGFSHDTTLLVWFIALNYSLFALTSIVVALTSGIPNGVAKMFQWVFWVAIAALAWMGA